MSPWLLDCNHAPTVIAPCGPHHRDSDDGRQTTASVDLSVTRLFQISQSPPPIQKYMPSQVENNMNRKRLITSRLHSAGGSPERRELENKLGKRAPYLEHQG